MFLISVLSVLSVNEKGVDVNLREEIKELISRIFYGRFNTSRRTGKVVVECISNVLGLVKLMLSSVIVDEAADVESFKEIILFIPFQVFFQSLI